MFKEKSIYKNHVTITVALLLGSTFFMFDFLQFNSGVLAAEQLDIIGNTSGNNTPSTLAKT